MNRRFTVDIDIGGTLTDGLISDGQQVWVAKVDTTPHDYTVCFFDCLHAAAGAAGFTDLGEFLEQVAVIRWSSTIATNVLAERKGPRIGLLVSAAAGGSQGEHLYGRATSTAVGHVIDPANITTISVGAATDEVLAAIRGLLEQGVRRICVSLGGAFADGSQEQAIKRMVEDQFPDHYLGAVPVLLGSEICRHPDDGTRTHMALINAYVHTPLAVALFKAEDELLDRFRYRRPVYIGHVNGGVARVAKTRGIDTTESGPVFGLVASAHFARQYGHHRVISLDVGGTTAKVAIIVDGEPVTVPETEFFGIPLKTPWTLLRSAALGGGSIARVQEERLTLGPDSMGAYPGPACYDLGGGNATLTDAFLVAGMLNPDRFLGGRRRLSVEQATSALTEHVARPLGVDAAAAARRVIDAAVEIVAATIQRTLDAAGYGVEGFQLYCFGGNGANFAANTAARLGLSGAFVFGLGPVFSTFGSSVSEICHIHEEWPYLNLDGANLDQMAGVIAAARERVLRDLEGEGLAAGAAVLTAELTAVGSDGSTRGFTGPADSDGVAGLLAQAQAAGGAVAQRVAVRGVSAVPRYEPAPAPAAVRAAEPYGDGSLLGAAAHRYDWDSLRPGARVAGPAVLEGETYTCTLPAGWELSVDGFGNGVLQKGGA